MGRGSNQSNHTQLKPRISARDLPFDVPVYGARDEAALEQLVRCLQVEDALGGALMADHHKGYSQPIGGVAAYQHHVSISGVGYDIGCGVKAVRTNLKVGEVPLAKVADEIQKRISFGLGRPNDEPIDHPVLDRIREADFAGQRQLLDKAAAQLGTVGSGNHYVDLLVEEDGESPGSLWIAVHFGSRGFGHTTANGFLSMANEDARRRGLPHQGRLGLPPVSTYFNEKAVEGEMDSSPVLVDSREDIGQAYIAGMELAGEYAYAGRDAVVERVLKILGAQSTHEVHNHHNFSWREKIGDTDAWVVRKGATPAMPGQQGFVGGSMGDMAVVVEGQDTPDAVQALHSTVHGAGRKMSRTKAAGKLKKRWICGQRGCGLEIRTRSGNSTPGKGSCPRHPNAVPRKVRMRIGGEIDWQATQDRLRKDKVILRGGGADEAPGVYKNLRDVLAAHEGQIAVTTKLRPVVVVMASPDTYDPFKD